MTLCSPDPQAFRPPEEQPNVLQVRLPTNFKAARFEFDEHTEILRDLESSIDAARLETDEGDLELPVKLRVHDSILVPMAKWAMLMAGNYRCIGDDRHALDPGRGLRGRGGQPRDIRVGARRVPAARGLRRGPRALREVRQRGREPPEPVVRCPRTVRRRATHRARRLPGASRSPPSTGCARTCSTRSSRASTRGSSATAARSRSADRPSGGGRPPRADLEAACAHAARVHPRPSGYRDLGHADEVRAVDWEPATPPSEAEARS